MSSKRFDIQGIRAWAVLAVVIFHFFPSLLPSGYLGVDVFFVLSGFLITLILEKKPCIPSTYVDFFFKRFKRIFPLALLVALINLIIISVTDDLKFAKIVARSATYSLFFGSNYNVRDAEENYFEAIDQAKDYFTHYWSLSVEIQFYTLAPFLLHILRPSHPTLRMIYLSLIATCSFALSIYLPPQNAFSSTLCRLFQFLAGSISYTLGEYFANEVQSSANSVDATKEQQELLPLNVKGSVEIIVKPRINYLYLIPLVPITCGSIVVIVMEDYSSLLRLSVTVAAAFLLFIQTTSPLLCHRYLQLMGDASYALYLVHWPVVCLLKEWEVHDVLYVMAAIFTCIVISVLIHLTYEKWYLTLSEYRTFALIGMLYLICFSLVYYNSTRRPRKILPGEFNPVESLRQWEHGSSINFTQAQMDVMNKVLDEQVVQSFHLPDCVRREGKEKNFCTFPNGLGNLSFLMIGNSFSNTIGNLVHNHFKKYYGRISLRAIPFCEPLIETNVPEIHDAHKKFLEDVIKEKPDVLFISTRYENPGVQIVGNISTDPLYLYMLNKLRGYEKLVKEKIFILNSFPLLFSPASVEKWRMRKGLHIEGFMPEAIRADDEPMRRRNRELAKHCDKCVFYDIRGQHLNEKGQFMTHDPISKRRYFDRTRHYTSAGLELIEPVFIEMSKEFERLLTSKYPENIFELTH